MDVNSESPMNTGPPPHNNRPSAQTAPNNWGSLGVSRLLTIISLRVFRSTPLTDVCHPQLLKKVPWEQCFRDESTISQRPRATYTPESLWVLQELEPCCISFWNGEVALSLQDLHDRPWGCARKWRMKSQQPFSFLHVFQYKTSHQIRRYQNACLPMTTGNSYCYTSHKQTWSLISWRLYCTCSGFSGELTCLRKQTGSWKNRR